MRHRNDRTRFALWTVLLLISTTGLAILACGLLPERTPIPPTPEPTQPSIGAISGMIWHDLCSNYEPGDLPPSGCVVASDVGGYLGNGVLEEGELGVEAAGVWLGEGLCPATGLASTTTGSDGVFTFSGLSPGIYCVTVDDSNQLPGMWTYPERAGAGSVNVPVGAGETTEGVNFGWDYFLLPPTSTPVPQATPTPERACTDRATFVRDVTIPDDTYIEPGKTFEKVWRLENSGTCSWLPAYSLVFISGYSMDGPAAVPLAGQIPPGSIVDLSVNLRAPMAKGTYRGYWMLRNTEGRLFGIGEMANRPVWVQVIAGLKPTPVITEWRGEYYDNRDLEDDPVLVRNDEEIDFNWRTDSPADELPKDYFSARWTREVAFDNAIYRFSVRVDDGARLTVDDRVVIDEWVKGADRVRNVFLLMSKGDHEIELEYFERADQARIHLDWEKRTDLTFEDWQGTYWFNRSLDSDWALVRNDPEIDFDWEEGSPADAIPSDDFSARWIRQVEFEPGVYRFSARSDDGIRMYLDDSLLIDEWHTSSGNEVYTKELTLDGTHWVKVEYYERGIYAKIQFWWEKISSLNDPPGALDDAYAVGEDEVLVVPALGVLDNDIDVNGDPLTAVLESGPSNGTLALNEDGSFSYTPAPDFFGEDSFTYKASDGSALSNGATVTITVNSMDDLPEATDDSATTQVDVAVEIDVLVNDSNLGDTPISLSVTTLPSSGVAEVVGSVIRYTPDAGFTGEDTFAYTVTDADGDSATAGVTVTVNP